jgi:uncharacterized protein with PQ loop repeat
LENLTFIDFVGYSASIVVLLSFLMKDVKRLRIINIIGCLLFVGYGVLLDFSIPLIGTNSAIAIINVVYLVKLKKKAM